MTELLKKAVLSAINKKYPDITAPNCEIEAPTDKTKADLVCTAAFLLAKETKKNPYDVAQEIVETLKEDASLAEYASFSSAKPGFINIEVTDKYLFEQTKIALEQANVFGRNSILNNEKWVIEHTSPNPNKAMHIGHLRNNVIGMSISSILEANGATVVCDAVDNDRGIAIVKAMWGFLVYKNKQVETVRKNSNDRKDLNVTYWFTHQNEWLSPKDAGIKADHFVGDCYALGAQDFKNNPASEKEMRDMLIKWEAKDPEIWALWKLILEYAHEGINQTLERLGNRWDKVWHESEHYESGKDLIEMGLDKKIFDIAEGGAVLTNLKKYKIPDTILLRSDGTSLYITQDLELTRLKKESYKADKLVWVIGPEQSLAMKQVFAVCEQLGIGKIGDFFHVPYGLVNVIDEDGKKRKMSSRAGDAILIDELIDKVKKQLILQRPNYTDKEAEEISIAAIKFMILSSGRMADITFDTEASIRLDGASGVYVLYTYARICSLLAKAQIGELNNVKFSNEERAVLINASYFPLIVRNSLKDFSPQFIAEYLIQLCQSFNSLYGHEKFISEENAQETSKKLLIAKACQIIIGNSLYLLGIKPVEKI